MILTSIQGHSCTRNQKTSVAVHIFPQLPQLIWMKLGMLPPAGLFKLVLLFEEEGMGGGRGVTEERGMDGHD